MKFLTTLCSIVIIVALAGASVLIMGTMVSLPHGVEVKIVKSGSMTPTIPVGSAVVVMPSPAYEVGDIITFGADTKKKIPTTHRIVAKEIVAGQTHFTTKGDANNAPDQSITTYRDIIGKVVFSAPRVGFLLDFVRSRKGFLTVIAAPASLIVLDELMTLAGAVYGLRRKPIAVKTSAKTATVATSSRPKKRNSTYAGINGYRIIPKTS